MLHVDGRKTFGLAVGAVMFFLSGLALPQVAAAEQEVSFAKQVKPILREYCVECHRPGGQGFLANGLDLSTYEGVIKGTKIGPVVIPGDVFTSNLLRAVLGQVQSSIRMPFHRAELPDQSTTLLLRWVYQGAKNN